MSPRRTRPTAVPAPESPPRPAVRVCAEPGCSTRLSRYNDDQHCSVHHPVHMLRTRTRHIA